MATWTRTLDGGEGYFLDFFVKEAITAGQVLMIEATHTTTEHGEVDDPADVNTLSNIVGCAANAVSYSATPTQNPTALPHSPENLVRIVVNPLSIWRFPVAGGTAANTALQPSSATPANILVNDTADLSTPDLVTDTAVGTISMVGGLLKGRTGNNKGAIRKINAHTNSVSTGVGVDFVNGIAVGDSFIRLPYSRAQLEIELTTDFTQVNGIETFADQDGTAAIVNVIIDEERDLAWVDVVFRDHYLLPESV